MSNTPDFVIDDSQRDTEPPSRTIVLNLSFDKLVEELKTTESFVFYTEYRSDVDVALLTDEGVISMKAYPHDGDVSPREMSDYFSGSEDEEPRVQDKCGVTFVEHHPERVEAGVTELLSCVKNLKKRETS